MEFHYKPNYTTGVVANLLGISQQTVIRCIDRGEMKAFLVPGSRFRRVPHEHLLGWLDGRPGFEHALARLTTIGAAEAPPATDAFGSLEVFTTGDLARLFGWAPRTSAKILDAGEIPSYRIPGSGDRRVARKALAAYLAAAGPELDDVRRRFEARTEAPGAELPLEASADVEAVA